MLPSDMTKTVQVTQLIDLPVDKSLAKTSPLQKSPNCKALDDDHADVYGQLVLLYHNGQLVDGPMTTRRRTKISLSCRPKANGRALLAWYWKEGRKPDYKPGQSYEHNFIDNNDFTIEYGESDYYDLFSVGRSMLRNDFVVDSAVSYSREENERLRRRTSRYAFRLLCDRNDPRRVSIYAGGLDANEQIVLGRKSHTYTDEKGNIDALLPYGIVICNPTGEFGESMYGPWREVSVMGNCFSFNYGETFREPLPYASNYLVDGTIIHLGGSVLMWRSGEAVRRKNLTVDKLHEMVKALNAARHKIGDHILVMPMLDIDQQDPEDEHAIPYVYSRCGHLLALPRDQKVPVIGRPSLPCHECFTLGNQLVRLRLGLEPALCANSMTPSHAFLPCGHVASYGTCRLWASFRMLNYVEQDWYQCPFCGKPIGAIIGLKIDQGLRDPPPKWLRDWQEYETKREPKEALSTNIINARPGTQRVWNAACVAEMQNRGRLLVNWGECEPVHVDGDMIKEFRDAASGLPPANDKSDLVLVNWDAVLAAGPAALKASGWQRSKSPLSTPKKTTRLTPASPGRPPAPLPPDADEKIDWGAALADSKASTYLKKLYETAGPSGAAEAAAVPTIEARKVNLSAAFASTDKIQLVFPKQEDDKVEEEDEEDEDAAAAAAAAEMFANRPGTLAPSNVRPVEEDFGIITASLNSRQLPTREQSDAAELSENSSSKSSSSPVSTHRSRPPRKKKRKDDDSEKNDIYVNVAPPTFYNDKDVYIELVPPRPPKSQHLREAVFEPPKIPVVESLYRGEAFYDVFADNEYYDDTTTTSDDNQVEELETVKEEEEEEEEEEEDNARALPLRSPPVVTRPFLPSIEEENARALPVRSPPVVTSTFPASGRFFPSNPEYSDSDESYTFESHKLEVEIHAPPRQDTMKRDCGDYVPFALPTPQATAQQLEVNVHAPPRQDAMKRDCGDYVPFALPTSQATPQQPDQYTGTIPKFRATIRTFHVRETVETPLTKEIPLTEVKNLSASEDKAPSEEKNLSASEDKALSEERNLSASEDKALSEVTDPNEEASETANNPELGEGGEPLPSDEPSTPPPKRRFSDSFRKIFRKKKSPGANKSANESLSPRNASFASDRTLSPAGKTDESDANESRNWSLNESSEVNSPTSEADQSKESSGIKQMMRTRSLFRKKNKQRERAEAGITPDDIGVIGPTTTSPGSDITLEGTLRKSFWKKSPSRSKAKEDKIKSPPKSEKEKIKSPSNPTRKRRRRRRRAEGPPTNKTTMTSVLALSG
uniref:RING-type domain-containing protein n=1 Tax=Trichogramma kaykai TaxID=54128 RepID=A0ABD2WH26_9HYME